MHIAVMVSEFLKFIKILVMSKALRESALFILSFDAVRVNDDVYQIKSKKNFACDPKRSFATGSNRPQRSAFIRLVKLKVCYTRQGSDDLKLKAADHFSNH